MKFIQIKNFRTAHDVLTEPMSKDELKLNIQKNGIIKVKLLFKFSDIVDNNSEWLILTASRMITNSSLGLNIKDISVAGRTTNNEIILKVEGLVVFENIY